MRRLFLAVLAIALSLVVETDGARAAFVNGVERFDGTSLDLTTWERANPAAAFTQNGALTISGDGNYSDYTTRGVTVGIGERVTADVALTAPQIQGTIFAAALLLTTNSGGTSTDTFGDSRYLGCQIVFDSTKTPPSAHFEALAGGPSNYGFVRRAEGRPTSGEVFHLSIAWVSQQQWDVSASAADETPIFTFSLVSPDPVPPDGLYVSLHRTNLTFNGNCSATFDNVTITPEPTSVLVAGGMYVLGCRCGSRNTRRA
jgi:hypothetical protein